MNLFSAKHIARILCTALVLQLALPLAVIAKDRLDVDETVQAISPVGYRMIGDLYLPSFGMVEKPVVKPAGEAFDLKKFKFEVPRLSERETREQIFNFFARNEVPVSADSAHFQYSDMPILLKDMEFLCGQGKEASEHVYAKIDNTVTLSGQAVLAKMLSTPTDDPRVLQERQEIIKTFLGSPELCQQVEAALLEFKKGEPALMNFWRQEEALDKALLKRVFFTKSFLEKYNNNPVALEVLTRLDNLNTIVWKFGGDFVFAAAIKILLEKAGTQLGKKTDKVNGKLPAKIPFIEKSVGESISGLFSFTFLKVLNPLYYWKSFNSVRNIETLAPAAKEALDRLEPVIQRVTNEAEKLPYMVNEIELAQMIASAPEVVAEAKKLGLDGDDFVVGNDLMKFGRLSSWDYKNQRAATYAVLGFMGVLAAIIAIREGFVFKREIAEAKLTRDSINFVQSRLIAVAPIVNSAASLLGLMNDERFAAAWEGGHDLAAIFAAAQNPQNDFDHLIADLQTDTFQGKASFFSFTGRVLANFNRMNTEAVREKLHKVLQAVGELDAYLSMAKLIKKHKKERVGYCFVNFVHADKPVLKIKGDWHPLIDIRKVVTNDLEMGGLVPANILLTGSNTGGKSTNLKTILLAILMAQTFGIAPAAEMTLAPFHYFGCYLHIQDDLAAGNSLFKAEVKRAQSIIERVKALASGQFAFLVIDELFTGTAAEKGQKAAYKMAKHLLENPSLSFIFATHFGGLTGMEKQFPNSIRNFKIDVYKDEKGNLVRPYKIEQGVSDQNVADQILQEEINDVSFIEE